MFTCHICGNTTARTEYVREIFTIDGRRVLVERIPAQVCRRCGEATFSAETTERVRRLVHGDASPVRTEARELFALG